MVLPVAALSLGLIAGCGGSPPGSGLTDTGPTKKPTTSAKTPEPAKPPQTATCRRLDYAAISRYSNATPTVPCTQPHTAYTFAVARLPASVSVHGVSIGNRSIQDAASAQCRQAFATYIGGSPATRALARLSSTYFLPTQRDFALGANWVRCDVIALQTFNELAAVPRKVAGFLNHEGALTSYGVCSDGDPGAAGSRLLMCSEPHTYRALAALRLGSENAGYPGKAVTATEGQQRCADLVAAREGADKGYSYAWTYPTVTDWSTGQRFGYCWLKSLR